MLLNNEEQKEIFIVTPLLSKEWKKYIFHTPRFSKIMGNFKIILKSEVSVPIMNKFREGML